MKEKALWKFEVDRATKIINISGRSKSSKYSQQIMLQKIVFFIETASKYEGSPFFSHNNECGKDEILVEASIIFLKPKKMELYLRNLQKILEK